MSGKKGLPTGIDLIPSGYRVRVYVDWEQHFLGTYPSLQDAKTALAIAHGQKAAGTFVPPKERKRQIMALREKERREAITVRQWADVWLEALSGDPQARKTASYKGDIRSPGTLRSYRSTLNAHVLDALGNMNLKEVTPERVEAVIEGARLKGGKVSTSAARNVARTLRAMFNAAIAANVGGVELNPVSVQIGKSDKVTGDDLEERTATPDQVRELAALMPEHLAIAVPLAAWCALRQGELLGLQRGDFTGLDKDDGAQVRIERQWHSKLSPPDYADPKEGSKRRIHVPNAVARMVAQHLVRYVDQPPGSPLFPSAHTPRRPLGQSALDRYWRGARDQVKPGMRFHDLRHTGLTYYAQQGATLKELMRRGGHTDMQVAMQYQSAARERDRTLTARLDAAIGEEE